MQIKRIESNQFNKPVNRPCFKALSLNLDGAIKLAGYFTENPGLEDVFIKQIAEPLSKLKTRVHYNGTSVNFKLPNEKYTSTIIDHYTRQDGIIGMIMNISGAGAYSKTPCYLNALKNPSNNFESHRIFAELEMAKNIAEDDELSSMGYNCDNKQTLDRSQDTKYATNLVEPGEEIESFGHKIISFQK